MTPAFATAAPRPGPSFCRMGGVLGGGRIDQDGGRKRLKEGGGGRRAGPSKYLKSKLTMRKEIITCVTCDSPSKKNIGTPLAR